LIPLGSLGQRNLHQFATNCCRGEIRDTGVAQIRMIALTQPLAGAARHVAKSTIRCNPDIRDQFFEKLSSLQRARHSIMLSGTDLADNPSHVVGRPDELSVKSN